MTHTELLLRKPTRVTNGRKKQKNKKKLLPQLSYLLFDDGGELSANALPPIDLVCEKWIILLHVLRTMTHIN